MNPISGLTLVDLRRDGRIDRMALFYRDILIASFPPDEIDPWEWFATALREDLPGQPSLHVFVVESSGRPVGGIVCEFYRRSRTLLATYIAVRPDLRRKGVGRWMIEATSQALRSSIQPLLVVGEVHDPRRWLKDDSFSRERILFYMNIGARVIAMPYFQPSLEPGKARVSGMLLLLFDADRSVMDPMGRVRASILADFVSEYLEATEMGKDHASDPEARGILGFLQSRQMVDTVDPGDLLRYEEPLQHPGNTGDVLAAMTANNDSTGQEANHD